MRLKITIAALAATLALASPAMAQTSAVAPAVARGTVLLPLTLINDEPLEFGTVLASGTAGWVAVDAEDGSRTADGTGVTLITLDNGGRAVFTATGTAGQSIDLTLTPPAGMVLNGPGGATVAIDNLRLDGLAANVLTDTRIMGAGDTLTIGVGGRFNIAANQQNGVYTADFSLTAEYN